MVFPWKIAIFGAGGTGGSVAEILARTGYREIALIDLAGDMAEGKAIDIEQSCALVGAGSTVIGGSDVALVQDADVVVITAGIGRRPGIGREELVSTNGEVMQGISRAIRALAPDAFVIVLTNPADILARIVLDTTKFPPSRVMAQGGILDSARLSHWVARLIGVSPEHVRAMVLGGHGDHMVPVQALTSVHGIPIHYLLSNDEWQTAVEHTRYGGGEILSKFKTHGAAVTPGYAVVQMIEALQGTRSQILPISVQSGGLYGLPKGVFIGLPARISSRGVEDILNLPIGDAEIEALQKSASTMEQTYLTWKFSQEDSSQETQSQG